MSEASLAGETPLIPNTSLPPAPVTVVRLGAFGAHLNCDGIASFLIGLSRDEAAELLRQVGAFEAVQATVGANEMCNVVVRDERGTWLAQDTDGEDVPFTEGHNAVGVLPRGFEVREGLRMKDRSMPIYRGGVAWGAMTDDRGPPRRCCRSSCCGRWPRAGKSRLNTSACRSSRISEREGDGLWD